MTAADRAWPGWSAVLADARQDERCEFHRPDLADERATGWERADVEQQQYDAAYEPELPPMRATRA